MRIIFALPDLGSGGAERVVSLLSSELKRKGYDIDILMFFGNHVHYSIDGAVNIVQMNLNSIPLFKRIKAVRQYVKAILQEGKAILVPFQDSVLKTCLAATIGLKIPVIACERNNPYIKGISLFKKLKAMLPYWLADHCIFQTHDAREYYSIIRDENCSVITNPITIPNITWIGEMSEKKLISVCRLHRQKNLPMTLDVVELIKKHHPEVHLSIFGEGPLKDTLEEEIRKRGLSNNVTLCGTTRQVPFELSRSSIFISTSDFEGISNSMLEAMAVGVPMVCTDCPIGGARLMLHNGAGILVPVGDVDYFAESVLRLLNGSIDYKKLSEMAIERAKEYTPLKISNKWC